MTGKIKIALCLSGEPRHSMVCFPYIYESFIDIGKEFDVDVFTHSRNNFRSLFLYKSKNHTYESNSKQTLFKYLDLLSLPSELKNQKSFYDSYTDQTNVIINPIMMFDAIQKCFNTAFNYDKYDIIIRCRYDFITDSKLNISSIIKNILSKKYNLFIPEKSFIKPEEQLQSEKEYNDQLAIGDSNSMEYYSNLIYHIPELLNTTKQWRSEVWLYEHLKQSNFKIFQYPLNLTLLRSVQIESNKGNPDLGFYNI